MQAITITLNGVEVSGHPGMTILDLARESGVHIPTLCHDPHLNPYGACRICVVENEQNGALLASCVAPIGPGMVINTHSDKVLESRRTIIKLILASHPDSCMVCDKGNRCSLRQIAADLGVGLVDLQKIPHPATIEEVNPFIERDLTKCIMCAKCIRADQELVVQGAIDFMNRGFSAHPATLGDLPLEFSDCTFCGTCVAICPTGALAERHRTLSGSTTKEVSTVCSFCGGGCNLNLEVSGNKVVRARPRDEDSPNGITLCARGAFGFDYIHSSERLTNPMMKVDGEFQSVSWEEAIAEAASQFNRIKESNGPDSLGVFGSSKCTNEENYILQKFTREVIGTNNIDNGGRLYNASGRLVLKETLGFAANTNPIGDIENSKAILLVGTDPEVITPIVGYAVKRAVKYRGAKLVIINSQPVKLNAVAHLFLQPNTGTVRILIDGLLKVIDDEELCNKDSVQGNIDELLKALEGINLAQMNDVTGVSIRNIRDAARVIGDANSIAIIHNSDAACAGSLSNLALLTGSLGRRSGGIFDLQHDSNGQGAADMGCLPDYLPGYKGVSEKSGMTIFEMFEQASAGAIKAMYIVGENPVANLPDTSSIEQAISSLDYLVVQDMFLTETAKLADLILPAASFAEKDGTFTNFERRVQRVRKAIDSPGEALPDWEIIQKMANQMGYQMSYSSPEEIMNEISGSVELYQGITYERLESWGMFWPESETDRCGTRRLYENGFPLKLGQFYSNDVDTEQSREIPAGKSIYQFGSGARSSRSARLGAMTSE